MGTDSKPEIGFGFVILIGVVILVCIGVIVAYIIYKTATPEGWLTILFVPIALVTYGMYIRNKYDVE